MASERTKEIREWITFIGTILTVVLVPIGIIVLDRNKLQIERDAAEKFVAKEAYDKDWQSHQQRVVEQRVQFEKEIDATSYQVTKFDAKLDAISYKLDASILNQTATQQQLLNVQEKLREMSKP